jgi:two-component system, OmpR family, copper resistance phosphate regulon response regulator CusR
MVQILIVEDEIKLAAAIADGLHGSEYKTTIVNSGGAGMKCIHESTFDLILLDLMLPGSSGLEILRALRRNGQRTPVLILTSKGSLDERVRGLDAGADDYLVKPFAFPELLARIRALQRRANPETPSILQLADLKMELSARSAARGNTPLALTAREFELLEYLLANRGTVVSREMIARDVWQSPVRCTTLDNVIDVHIARIRRKLDDPFQMKLLHTVRGVGFVLRKPEEI